MGASEPQHFLEHLSFLESSFQMSLGRFEYDPDCFGNIIAEYSNGDYQVRFCRDRGIVETSISTDGNFWQPLDALLKLIGESPSVKLVYSNDHDYFGNYAGNDIASQSAAIRSHLPAIARFLASA